MPPVPPEDAERFSQLATATYRLADLLEAADVSVMVPRPELPDDPVTVARVDEVIDRCVGKQHAVPELSRDRVRLPLWVFLEHAVRHRGLLLHGSNRLDLEVLTPRAAEDNLEGGGAPRVHAASSGILAAFYAVVDRDRLSQLPVVPALNNLYVAREGVHGLEEYFHFALDYRALPHRPWRTGAVYLLERAGFEPDEGQEQWFSTRQVTPIARVVVQAQDWPLLDSVRGVDFVALLERSALGLDGLPWWPDPTIYP